MFNIQERSRLIQDNNIWFLTDSACKKHSLALSVTDIVKVTAAKSFCMYRLHSFFYLFFIFPCKNAKPSCIRITAGCYNVMAGHQLRLHSLSKNYSHTGRQIPKGKGQQILVVKIDLSANDLQLSCNTF